MSRTQVPNWMVAPDVARPNLLPNGGFEVWQVPTVSTHSQVFADPWQAWIGVVGTGTLSRDTVNTDGSPTCLSIVATSGVTAGNPVAAQNVLRLADMTSLRGRTVTLSARVRTSVANACRISIFDGTVETYSAYHPGDNTYRTLSVTVTIAANATTVTSAMKVEVVATAYFDNVILVEGRSLVNYEPVVNYPDALPNARIASDLARANQLTNGGFEIWQRGNGPFTGSTPINADRWLINLQPNDAMSVSRDTANADVGSTACAAVSFTLNGGSGISSLIQWNLNLSSTDYSQLIGRTITLSIRVKTNTPNAVRASINSYYSSVSHYTYSNYHTGDGTYQTLVVSMPVGVSPVPMLQVGVSFSVSCTAYVDNAMLVVGAAPSDYFPLHPADDLARCLRYYDGLQLKPYNSYGGAGQQISYPIYFSVRKPVAPTLTKTSAWTSTNCGSLQVSYNHTEGTNIMAIVTALGAYAIGPSGGYDFTAEANP